MKGIVFSAAMIVFAFALDNAWLTAILAVAGTICMLTGILVTTKKCKCCGYKTQHSPHCREIMHL